MMGKPFYTSPKSLNKRFCQLLHPPYALFNYCKIQHSYINYIHTERALIVEVGCVFSISTTFYVSKICFHIEDNKHDKQYKLLIHSGGLEF